MVFWHPRGLAIYRALEEAQRAQLRREGHEEVRSPQLLRRPIWEASGHWRHFADAMRATSRSRVGSRRPTRVACRSRQ